MSSGPITSWQIDRETVETAADYFLSSRITADGDCSHEIKRHWEKLKAGGEGVTEDEMVKWHY